MHQKQETEHFMTNYIYALVKTIFSLCSNYSTLQLCNAAKRQMRPNTKGCNGSAALTSQCCFKASGRTEKNVKDARCERTSLCALPVQQHGPSPTCPTAVCSNSHKCTHARSKGIINHRHLGEVSADYAWCLWFSMTESSCLEPQRAPRGAVNLAD